MAGTNFGLYTFLSGGAETATAWRFNAQHIADLNHHARACLKVGLRAAAAQIIAPRCAIRAAV